MKKFSLKMFLICLLFSMANFIHAQTLAFDDFNATISAGTRVQLLGVSTGGGWAANWDIQNGLNNIPGYNVSNETPLSYSSLESSTNYATGGESYVGSGRGLDLTTGGPFVDYLEGSAIGKAGTTLWFSALLRNESGGYKFGLKNGGSGWTGTEQLMISKVNANWGLTGPVLTSALESSVACVDNEVIFAVLKLEFGASSTDVSLYINPTDLGGTEPSTPTLTTTTTAALLFTSVKFYPGSGANQGSLDEIRFGATYADVSPVPMPTIDNIPNPAAVMNDAGMQTINMTGIGDGVGGSNTITITATSSNTSVIPNPTVVYTSADATGSLTYTPAGPGTATVTVTVSSSAVAVDKVITFDVEILNGAINNAPTVDDNLANLIILTSSGVNTVNITGIADGDDNKVQTLTLSASSSNIAVIPNPTPSYTSDNTTGSISFTPTGTEGTATITVTVTDDGGTASGGINTVSISFTVEVLANLGGLQFIDDFSDGTLTWYGDDYDPVEEDGVLKLYGAKRSPWVSFGVNLPSAIDISANPVLNFNAKIIDKEWPYVLTAYLSDGSGSFNISKRLVNSDHNHIISYDFSAATIDLTNVTAAFFAINGAALTWYGETWIEDVRIGAAATKLCNFNGIANHFYYKNSGSQSILITNVENVSSFSVTGGDALIENISFSSISGGKATLTFDIKSDATGSDEITLTGVGETGYANNIATFDITVENNVAPTIDALNDMSIGTGKLQRVKLSGISDGNIAENQNLTITASSDAPSVIVNPQIVYSQGSPYGELIFTPVDPQENITFTITINDGADVNNITTTSFNIDVYDGFNYAPSIANPGNQAILLSGGAQTINLSEIMDGDGGGQTLTITAISSETAVMTNPTATYTQGESTGVLNFTPLSIGTTTITLTVSDDGDNGSNNGDASYNVTFNIEVLADPVTGYTYPMVDWATESSLYNPNGKYSISYENFGGSMALRCDFTNKSTWDGIWSDLPAEIDVSEHPYISCEIYPVGTPRDFHIYYYDIDGKRNLDGTHAQRVLDAPADQWTTVFLDYRGEGYMLDNTGEPLNGSRITSILINMHDEFVWPFTNNSGTLYIRNLKLGSDADLPVATPTCTVKSLADESHIYNASAPQVTINLAGISNGDGSTTGVTASVSSSNTTVANPTISAVNADGTATLTYTPGAVGTTNIAITISAAGSNDYTDNIDVTVMSDNASNAIAVNVDLSTKYQTIQGFGTFQNKAAWADLYATELGASAMRIGLIGNQLEPFNDNNDPYVLDRSKLNYNVFDWDYLRDLHEKGVETFILTSWSPPAWMKDNLSVDYQSGGAQTNTNNTDNKLSYHQYEEFAEMCVAIVRLLKEESGIDLAGIGLQNEPVFHEPYASAILDPSHFVELIKVVGARFASEGITTKIFMPEQVFSQGANSMAMYIDALQADPIANQYCSVIATHGYAEDGIGAGQPDFSEWSAMYSNAQEGIYPKELWMTETYPEYTNWESSISAAGAILGALEYGSIGLWTSWSFQGQLLDKFSKPTPSFWTNKNFFNYIRPGAVRVKSTEPVEEADLLVTTFINEPEDRQNIATVIINKGYTAMSIDLNITGGDVPTTYDVFTSKEHAELEQTATGLSSGDLISVPARSVTTILGYGTTYTLTVNNGTGSGEYSETAEISIVANDPPIGQVFNQWIGDVAAITDATSPITTVTMPAANTTVTAEYINIPKSALTVNKGTGDGNYVKGAIITIAADDSTSNGSVFVGWTGDVQYLTNPSDSATTLTMPDAAVSVTANYQDASSVVRYNLTVNNGTGGGNYIEGATVNISANAPATNYEFSHWSGDNSVLSDTTLANASLTMPTTDLVLTAEYKALVKYTLTITSGFIQGAGGDTTAELLAGEQVTIVAAPAPAGQNFINWTGDVSGLANYTSATTVLTMPAANVDVTANYSDVVMYTVTVNNGDGQDISQYIEGTNVNISPDSLWNMAFDSWSGDLALVSANANDKFFSFAMPAQNVEFTANYVEVQGTLTFTISDNEDNILEGVTVSAAGIKDYTTTSDANGVATLSLDYDDYVVTISKDGYQTRTIDIRIEADLLELPFTLRASAVDVNENFTGITAYPIPASSILNISIENQEWTGANLFMYDVTGKCCLTQSNVHAGVNTLDVENLQKGFYFIKLQNQKQSISFKILID